MPQYTRAISGNINPYAAEAVVFDSTPAVQYALQQEAKKQAAQDAIDRHLQEMQVVDYSKMRPQDQADFVNGFNKDVKEYYTQNRDLLRDKGEKGVAARLELAQRMAAKKADIGRSLQYAAEDKELNDFITKLKEKGVAQNDQTINVLGNRSLSMYNDKFYKNPFTKETYKTNDIQDIYKEFNPDQWVKDITAGKMMNEPIVIAGTEKQLPNFQKSYKTRQSYTDKDYNDIVNNAAYSYDSSPSIKNFFDNQFHNMPNYPTLNAEFKQKTGRDIQNGRDAAMAMALNMVQKEKIGEKVSEDKMGLYSWQHNFNDRKQEEKDLKLVQSLANTFNNPQSINLIGKKLINVLGNDVYDISGVFGNNLKTEFGRGEGDGKEPDKYLKGVFYNPKNNAFTIQLNDKREAERLFGQKFDKLSEDNAAVQKAGGVFVTIPASDKKSMQSLVNSLAVVNGVSGERARIRTQNIVRNGEQELEKPKIEKNTNNTQKLAKPKYTATGANGVKIFSNDGINWVDSKGNKIQ